MIRRLLCLLMIGWLAVPAVHAEEPQRLSECRTVEQVEAMLLYPDEDISPVAAEKGLIRYISQDTNREPGFCAAYWLGGEPGSEFDLTLEADPYKNPYLYYARNMCTRAVYSMALSCLGVDLTPGAMTALLEKRDISAPYDEVTGKLPEIERVQFPAFVFQNMYEAYQSDPDHYSPIYLYIRRPNETTHALLVVAQREDGRFIVVDPKYHEIDGEPVHVYTIRLNPPYRYIVASDFQLEQAQSTVLGCCQWRLIDEE